MATNLYIEVANQKGINSPSDHNPIVPPDISPPGTYNFNLYFLDFADPGQTDAYHRYPSASIELNVRQNGPPTSGSFTLTFVGFTTSAIDISASKEDILSAFTALKSVGGGNAQITGDAGNGWTIEFIGERAGLAQSPITVNASGCSPASTATVKQIQTGAAGVNSKQKIQILQDRVATTNLFTELTAGSNWGWATSSGLSTSGVPQSFWQNPSYDVVLEVRLFIAGSRAGTDGVTTQLAARSGSDGVTHDDGLGRSGTDGVIVSSTGRTVYSSGTTGTPLTAYGNADSASVANSLVTSVSNAFSSADIGRTITALNIKSVGTWLASNNGTNVTSLTGTQTLTAAGNILSIPNSGTFTVKTNGGSGVAVISYNGIIAGNPGTGQGTQFLNCSLVSGSGTLSTTSSYTLYVDMGALSSWPGTFGPVKIDGIASTGGFTNNQAIFSTSPYAHHVDLYSATLSDLNGYEVGVGQNVLESASANFTPADVGHAISGDFIPAGATIAQWRSSTKVSLSLPLTGGGSGLSWTIAAQNSTKYTSATAAFTASDVGRAFSGNNIPANTTIATYIDAQNVTLSNSPNGSAQTGLAWSMPAVMSSVYTTATGAFTSADIGKILAGTNVPTNTTIISIVSTTQVQLSQVPTAPGTVLSWSIISTTPGSSAPPTITRKQTGSTTLAEIQRIAFAEIPDYGNFAVTLNGVTSAPISAPIDAATFAAALNNAFPANANFQVSASAKCVFDVTFGVTGAQSLFTVNDTNVVYDNTVMRVVLVKGQGIITILPPDITILYDGNFSAASAISKPRVTNLSDGTGAIEIRQRFMQLSANWQKLPLNSFNSMYGGVYLIAEDGMDDIGGGLVTWDRVWASRPGNRKIIVQNARPTLTPARTYNTSGVLVDIQTVSFAGSSWGALRYYYDLGAPSWVPADSPIGVVVHFSDGSEKLYYYNGFDPINGTFFRGSYVWSWSRRIWKGDIWETQVLSDS